MGAVDAMPRITLEDLYCPEAPPIHEFGRGVGAVHGQPHPSIAFGGGRRSKSPLDLTLLLLEWRHVHA